MEMTLDMLRPGRAGKVVQVAGEGAVRRRLLDMGITPGIDLHVRKVAPMGDPMEITVRGYQLTLRKAEAHAVHMQA